MAGLQRGQDALGAGQVVEGGECLGIGDGHVLRPAGVLEPGMLRTDTGIVQPGGNGVGFDDLPVGVLHQVGPVAMQHAGLAVAQRCGMPAGFQAVAAGLDAIHGHAGIVEERIEQADGIGSPADTGNQCIRQPPGHLQCLLARLAADDGLEVAHHGGIGMRPGNGADNVERVIDVGDPVAQCLVKRVLEGLRARLDRHDLRAHQLHAVDVDGLALDVLGAHVDHAVHAEPGRDGGRGNAVLPCPGLGDNAPFAHALCQQRLADGVVDLVGTGMIQVLALEVDARTADLVAPALRVVQR
jgi:hypothetical protein